MAKSIVTAFVSHVNDAPYSPGINMLYLMGFFRVPFVFQYSNMFWTKVCLYIGIIFVSPGTGFRHNSSLLYREL